MPTIRRPRKGSLQFWRRKRATRMYARVRSWFVSKDVKPSAFAGYKVGMTHIMAVNENKNSHLKGELMSVPVTILECPPMRFASARFYQKENAATVLIKEIFFKTEKELLRKTTTGKENKADLDSINPDLYDNITVTVYTQPKKAGFGKKKPEIFEIALGGTNTEKVTYLKENADKEFAFDSVFGPNNFVDVHGITKGKGFQGPMKRFGIGRRSHKSEKSIRNPGSLGPWVRQQHISWKVPHAGQTGYHQRVEYNKQVLEISNEVEKYGVDFHKYGNIKSTFILIHGSVAGPKKRLLIMTKPKRAKSTKHKLAIQ